MMRVNCSTPSGGRSSNPHTDPKPAQRAFSLLQSPGAGSCEPRRWYAAVAHIRASISYYGQTEFAYRQVSESELRSKLEKGCTPQRQKVVLLYSLPAARGDSNELRLQIQPMNRVLPQPSFHEEHLRCLARREASTSLLPSFSQDFELQDKSASPKSPMPQMPILQTTLYQYSFHQEMHRPYPRHHGHFYILPHPTLI